MSKELVLSAIVILSGALQSVNLFITQDIIEDVRENRSMIFKIVEG